MDSQDSQPPLHHHHHHHPHHQNIMVGQPQQQQHHHQPNSYSFAPANNISPHQQPHLQQNQHQHQQQQRFPLNPMATSAHYADGGGGGGTSSPSGGGGVEGGKKKRGRPRKYSPDGAGSSIALGLSPTPASSSAAAPETGGGGGVETLSSEAPAKKHRGRPPGSEKRQLDALGTVGIGFTPHVITVKAGEDIASKIMAFSQQGPRTVCILSANGAICNVTLRQPAMSGGTVSYEGRFEIISLSGSFLMSESNGSRSRTGGLSVSLAGSDGRVLGGGVAGVLTAATPVQVVVGSFIQDGKKPKYVPSIAPASNMSSFGNTAMADSPPSQDDSSHSFDDDDGSPTNQGTYANAGKQMHNIPMYTGMGWGNSTMKMHQN